MALGSKLKIILTERGITVKDFANKIQIPPTTLYSFIKRDSSTGKLELIAKICKGLDMYISEFLDDDLFNAATSLDAEHEKKIIDEKIKSIVENSEYSEQEKESLLQDLMTQLENKRNAEKGLANARKAIEIINSLPKEEICCITPTWGLLNDEGKQKANEHIEMLGKIPEYQRKEENED